MNSLLLRLLIKTSKTSERHFLKRESQKLPFPGLSVLFLITNALSTSTTAHFPCHVPKIEMNVNGSQEH